ncbi:hypothetical protein [Sinorhizobium prairiense]|uniref:hypothetical protein n=1 Tax=unclassified Sinorhizobium TaxID=2613772 RepID=UPI0023D8A930|nr:MULTISPECIES: hypothetical protein [unclassified Sinorhizobium]WEJ09814.1 hypothetical protein N0Q90_17425 [Sinorhizobium sp. M103]WEJ15636.1 hypothetical protein N0Q91_02875 [Sinorhizobium sp. K101]WEJ36777.1 hypothetical protein N0R80_17400 [Sinorhizobium sp. C101]
MHSEKINEIVAHFIGLFNTAIDDARIRFEYLQGYETPKTAQKEDSDYVQSPDFRSDFALESYDPEISYELRAYDIARLDSADHAAPSRHHLDQPAAAAQAGQVDVRSTEDHGISGNGPEASDTMPPAGPDAGFSHIYQASTLHDDDVVNLTGMLAEPRNLTHVDQTLEGFLAEALEASPFAQIGAADAPASFAAVAANLEALASLAGASQQAVPAAPATGGPEDLPQAASPDELVKNEAGDAVLIAERIEGTYVNGTPADAAPELRDNLPGREHTAHPAGTPLDKPLQNGELDIHAGTNVVANVASVVGAVEAPPVTAVMGDYHQIDVISQSYVYADRDTLDGAISGTCATMTTTVALNIASFGGGETGACLPQEAEIPAESSTFPTSWRVNVVEGDLSIVHWVEQYNFASDNDSLTVTRTGAETTVLSGGNTAVNVASFLGIAEHYDLILVGGRLIDLDVISQISILYDNDDIAGVSAGKGIALDTGGNLVWNMASIGNVSSGVRFEAMPDYFHEAADQMHEGDGTLPDELLRDNAFEDYADLHILFITGNLYDVTIVQQVSILGDADAVSFAAGKLLEDGPEASVAVHTGNNGVFNVAEIIDSGGTTYVGGETYSDAVLIQSGIVDGMPDLQRESGGLTTELIAFIGEDTAPQGGDMDGDHGTDLSGSEWSDVMHTILA